MKNIKKHMDKLLIGIIAVFLIGGGTYFVFQNQNTDKKEMPAPQITTTFEECATKYPVMESSPRQCDTPDGKHFVEIVENMNNENKAKQEITDSIKIDSPRPNKIISSPLTISGQARGTWFFEGSAPIKIVDANNNILGSGFTTGNEWMTENFVPFTASIEFGTSTTATGNLIIENNNPSGLPENNRQLTIPIKFILTPSDNN